MQTISSDKAPIILIPGFLGSGRYLVPLKRYLEAHGYPCVFYFKKRRHAPLTSLSSELSATIQSSTASHVILIAHSTGAIIALEALKNPIIRNKIKWVITLGAPFKGSLWGSLLYRSVNYDFMRYNSPHLALLTKNPAINKKFICLRARFDEIVFPRDTLQLNGAQQNIELPIDGHMNMLFDRTVFKTILAFLD